MADYSKLPHQTTLDVKEFRAHVDEEKLRHFKALLELSPIASPVFENTSAGRRYGMTREWLADAKNFWLNEFNWRKQEDRINSFPNFKASVQDSKGNVVDLHFVALFSEKEDATPIALIHVWPSSICEYLDILDLLRNKYSPVDLPYHVIVPSLPGYAYSSGAAIDVDYGVDLAAQAIHDLMMGLGFGSGYLTQGGDLGSFISRFLAMSYDACKGMHVNMMGIPPEESDGLPSHDESEKRAVHRASEAIDTAYGFALQQGTRPATIGLVLNSSPLALLSWIGEKFLEWTDEDPPLEKILQEVTLYWMTDTVPRCLYHNRGMGCADEEPKIARMSVVSKLKALKLPYVTKPCGYSLFAHEIVPVPKSWATKSCNLVFFNQHDRGGHFPAMERPHELLADIEEYVKVAWARVNPSGGTNLAIPAQAQVKSSVGVV